MPPSAPTPSSPVEEAKIDVPTNHNPQVTMPSHLASQGDTPSTLSIEPEGKAIRKRDFGFIPIPKSRRYDPSMKPEECFPWSMRMNLVFASAAVRVACIKWLDRMLICRRLQLS